MSRYRVEYRPAGTLIGRDVTVGVNLKPVPPPLATAEPAAGCVTAVSGLAWWGDPPSPANYRGEFPADEYVAIAGAGTVTDSGGVNFPDSPGVYLARINGDLCPGCTVEWTVEWVPDEAGTFSRPFWYHTGRHLVMDVSLTACDPGVLTASAVVTCGSDVYSTNAITFTFAES